MTLSDDGLTLVVLGVLEEVVDVAEGTVAGFRTGPVSSLAVPDPLPSDTSPLASTSPWFSLEADCQPKMARAADIVGETLLPPPK